MTEDDLDAAYAASDAFHTRQYVLWLEWANMVEGRLPEECEDNYAQLRKAALDHRGQP
jgi:hypothetical protein